jgi:hypothetical protein
MTKISSISIKRDLESLLATAFTRLRNSNHPEKVAFYQDGNYCVVGACISAATGEENILEALHNGVLDDESVAACVQALFFSIPRDIRDAEMAREFARGKEYLFDHAQAQYRRRTIVYAYNDQNSKETILRWINTALIRVGRYPDAQ